MDNYRIIIQDTTLEPAERYRKIMDIPVNGPMDAVKFGKAMEYLKHQLLSEGKWK